MTSLRMNNQWITEMGMNNQWMTGLGMNGPNERIYKKRRRSTAQQELKHIQLQDLNRTRKQKKPANNYRLYLAGGRVSPPPPFHIEICFLNNMKYENTKGSKHEVLKWKKSRFFVFFLQRLPLLNVLSNWSCQLNPFYLALISLRFYNRYSGINKNVE